ncbi:MAG: hypothetical protein NT167_19510 [Verrucomicrobia bacterium]|nr:hypothetical protein [Verrucomicrobiota bacterium]
MKKLFVHLVGGLLGVILIESLMLPAVTVGGEMRSTSTDVNSEPKSDSARSAFQSTKCAGVYAGHLQGICTDERDAIYWSWTDTLVKTEAHGHVLKQVFNLRRSRGFVGVRL